MPVLLRAGKNEIDRRLDRIIRKLFPHLSLGGIYRAIRTGDIKVNGKRKNQNYRLNADDEIFVLDSLLPENTLQSEGTRHHFDTSVILFENDDILILNKSRGILTHGQSSLTGDIIGYLQHPINNFSTFKPGPLHRLDRNTSGVISFGKTVQGAQWFSRLISLRQIDKYYITVLDGVLPGKAYWSDPLERDTSSHITRKVKGLSGSMAELEILPLASRNNRTFAAVRLLTGITHQIRCQCALHGYPLTGDRKYGKSLRAPGYLLHALLIRFPESSKLLPGKSITAPLQSSQWKRLGKLFPHPSIDRIIDAFLSDTL